MTPITDKGILLIFTYVNNNIKSSLYILAPESLHVCGCHGIPLHSIRAARQIGADAVIGVVCIVLVQTCTKLLTRGRFQRSIGSPSFWFAEINTNVILLTLYTVIYIWVSLHENFKCTHLYMLSMLKKNQNTCIIF